MQPNQSIVVWGSDGEFYSIHRVGHGGWYHTARQSPLPLVEEQQMLMALVAAAQARMVQIDHELESIKPAELKEGRLAFDTDGLLFHPAAVRINLVPQKARPPLRPPLYWGV